VLGAEERPSRSVASVWPHVSSRRSTTRSKMASASDVDEDTDRNMAIDKPGVVGLVVELRVVLNCRGTYRGSQCSAAESERQMSLRPRRPDPPSGGSGRRVQAGE